MMAAYDERFDKTGTIAWHGGYLGLLFVVVSQTSLLVHVAGQPDWKSSCKVVYIERSRLVNTTASRRMGHTRSGFHGLAAAATEI
jgi:hypothetical protein